MKFIYHTSHCGSTLLTALLGQRTKAYSEPNFSMFAPKKEVLGYDLDDKNLNDFFTFLNDCPEYDNIVVKISSQQNMVSIFNKNKKVFLYNNLKRHLSKYLSYRKAVSKYYPNLFDTMTNTPHPKLIWDFEKSYLRKPDLGKISVFMWAHSLLWLKESVKCLWINSEEFYFDREETMKKICDWLEIELPFDLYPKKYINKDKYMRSNISIQHNEAYLNEDFEEIKKYDDTGFKEMKDYAFKNYKNLEPYFENEKHIK